MLEKFPIIFASCYRELQTTMYLEPYYHSFASVWIGPHINLAGGCFVTVYKKTRRNAKVLLNFHLDTRKEPEGEKL